jgi:iron complex transport system ATP-binding protein
MSEPTSGLDYGNQIRLLERIAGSAHEGYSLMLTTHHPDHTLAIADCTVMMQAGTIVCDGIPSSRITPKNIADLYNLSDRLFVDAGSRCPGIPRLHPDGGLKSLSRNSDAMIYD